MATVARSAAKAHPVVSHEAWLAARQALLVQEKELTRLRDELSQECRAVRCRPGWGTRFTFDLTEDGGQGFIRPPSLEGSTGQGRPFPSHVRI